MCGIFVAYSKNGNKLSKKKCLLSIEGLYNRGPDFFKHDFLRNETLFISNTILSITGKTKKNKNLTSSKNKNFCVSFNGEIYNYNELNNYQPIDKTSEYLKYYDDDSKKLVFDKDEMIFKNFYSDFKNKN